MVDFNGVENYTVNFLIPSNIKTCKQDLKMIAGKYQDKYKFILNNALCDVK